MQVAALHRLHRRIDLASNLSLKESIVTTFAITAIWVMTVDDGGVFNASYES